MAPPGPLVYDIVFPINSTAHVVRPEEGDIGTVTVRLEVQAFDNFTWGEIEELAAPFAEQRILNIVAPGGGHWPRQSRCRFSRHSKTARRSPRNHQLTRRPLPDIGEPTVTRNFSFDYTSGHWTINSQAFDPNRIDAHPVLGTTEKWVFTNPTGSTHMVHIHDVDQQRISRDGGSCYPYETMKETWSLGSGETLELKMRFTDHIGIYMFHCHILEHEDDGMMSQFEVVPPIAPMEAVSRKIPGGNGTFDIELPLTGNAGIECRSGGATNDYELVVSFASPVTILHASITAGTGSVVSTTGNGTTAITLNLTGVTNAQTINVTLFGVNDGKSTNEVTIPMSVLIGDTNGNGTVNSSDVSQVKSESGHPLTSANAREDVNGNGSINRADVALVNSRAGTSIAVTNSETGNQRTLPRK